MASPNADGTRKWRVTVLISGSGSNLQALLDASTPSQSSSSSPSSSSSLPLANCQITSILSSRSDAYGLTRGRTHVPPIPSEAFPLLRWRKIRSEADAGADTSRAAWEQKLAAKIRATRPDVVVLAGWMLILGEGFLNALVRDWDEPLSPSPSSPSSSSSSDTPASVDPTGSSISTGLSTPGSSPYSDEIREGLKGRRIPIINLHPALPGQFPGAHAIKDAWDAFNTPVESTLRSSSTAASEVLSTLDSSASSPADASTATAQPAPRRITKTGLMIHRVIPLLDAGAPIVVKEVPMIEGESLEDLEGRIHKVEHVALVEAVGEVVRLVREGEWWREEEVGRSDK
ncbi:hypothetical protein JCM8547_000096 [Rhodosporidiobolus lusitaniae]